jgi:hypothetical protein
VPLENRIVAFTWAFSAFQAAPDVDECADDGDQFLDRGEGAAAGDNREEAFHEVEPGASGRREVQLDPVGLEYTIMAVTCSLLVAVWVCQAAI